MKQVIFAIALLAMASLTGCLTDDESSVDETTDDTTSDTTEDNTDTTEDDSDTADDTKDDELIDPVGTNGGYTPPEDSSIFFRDEDAFSGLNGPQLAQLQPAVLWTCIETGCTYVPTEIYENYTSPSDNIVNYSWDDYNINSDLLLIYGDAFNNTYLGQTYTQFMYRYGAQFNFQGWVNKTGNTVTIEGLPMETMGLQEHYEYPEYLIDAEKEHNYYYITIFGQNGLFMTTQFVLSSGGYFCELNSHNCMDSNTSEENYLWIMQQFTVNIDLPFEPVSFTITDTNGVERTRFF